MWRACYLGLGSGVSCPSGVTHEPPKVLMLLCSPMTYAVLLKTRRALYKCGRRQELWFIEPPQPPDSTPLLFSAGFRPSWA